MDSKPQDPAANPGTELRPDERESKVGDLGRGSHEQTQGSAAEPPQSPPRGEPAPEHKD
jgi:hypothetical protein